MDDWPTLPQLARELGVADSTARRWAAAFPDLLPTKGHGSARRFHPQSREVLGRVQSLYTAGFNTEQISAMLNREFPATIDVIEVVSEGQAHERKEVEGLQSVLVGIFQQQTQMREEMSRMETRFLDEIAAAREENSELRSFIDERLEERDRKLMETLRMMQERAQEESKQQKKGWWPWRR